MSSFTPTALDRALVLFREYESKRVTTQQLLVRAIQQADQATLDQVVQLVRQVRQQLTEAVSAMHQSLDAIYGNLAASCDALGCLEGSFQELAGNTAEKVEACALVQAGLGKSVQELGFSVREIQEWAKGYAKLEDVKVATKQFAQKLDRVEERVAIVSGTLDTCVIDSKKTYQVVQNVLAQVTKLSQNAQSLEGKCFGIESVLPTLENRLQTIETKLFDMNDVYFLFRVFLYQRLFLSFLLKANWMLALPYNSLNSSNTATLQYQARFKSPKIILNTLEARF